MNIQHSAIINIQYEKQNYKYYLCQDYAPNITMLTKGQVKQQFLQVKNTKTIQAILELYVTYV